MSLPPLGDRPLRVGTTLGSDAFMLVGLKGEEGASTAYHYTLDLLSDDPAVDTASLLRTPVSVEIAGAEGDPVLLHGRIRSVVQLGQAEDLTAYQVEMVPWLWFLTLFSNCRIFQNETVPDIVSTIFRDRGFSDFEIRLGKSYPTREYCVQYRESDFDFVSRLLEEEGIHYFFEHDADRHLLALSDQSALAPACDGGETRMAADAREAVDIVTALSAVHDVHMGEVVFRDFDFEQAPHPIETALSGAGEEEVFDYHPGRFTDPGEGERRARILLERDEAGHEIIRGEGTCRNLRAGQRFDLVNHYRPELNRGYFVTSVTHEADGGEWRSDDTGHLDHRCAFEAIPVDTPWRPPRKTPRPRISGTQTAIVVGKQGEEIWVDRYGRVKVKFHWDRSDARDENSSCWIRVSTAWAGRNWGVVSLPRIGEEVIVDFLEGDPDQPLIIGRVYNAERMPPHPLPDEKTRSGIRTRSTMDGSPKTFNELRFEDLKGKEEVYIHAERDKTVVVENDRRENVGHDETIKIGNDRKETVGKNETITIGEDRSETVGGNESVTIGKNRDKKVAGDDDLKVAGERSAMIAKTDTTKVGGKRVVVIGGNDALSVGGNVEIDANGNVTITSPKSIEFKVGATTVRLDGKGVTIKGAMVQVEGTASVKTKAPTVGIDATAMAEVKGAVVTVKGNGMLQLRGGITMIN